MILIMSAQLQHLFQADGRRFHLDRGQLLFHAADPVRTIWFLTAGWIVLRRATACGTPLILHIASEGDLVAEASAFSERYHCDAEAQSECSGLCLPKESFLSALSRDPKLATEWAAELAHGLQSARRRAEIRSIRTVSDRLDAWLETGGEIPEKGRWQDLAFELGISREALYRELARRRA